MLLQIPSNVEKTWLILMIIVLQKYSHPLLDTFMGAIALVVSVEFYTFILPLLFWVSLQHLQITLP